MFKVSTHEAKYQHITTSFLNAKLFEPALNEPQLPLTGIWTSSHYIQDSKCIYKRIEFLIDHQRALSS